jgi:hypothetical protein
MAGALPTVIKRAPRNAEQAPFIYFDGVASYGVSSGAIQIELAADVIIPGELDAKTDVVMTAHLRCTPAAAISLQQALNKILEVLNMPTAVVSEVVGKPN